MKIILLVDVKNLGKKGSVIEVSDGMAQNMLFPQKKALPATHDNMNKHMATVADKTNHQGLITKKAEDFVLGLPEVFSLSAPANASGTLFKSISEKDIISELTKVSSIAFPSDVIINFQPIKTRGEFSVEVTIKNSKLKKSIKLLIV